jgi:CheY-like chemotaxis protein
MSEDSDARIILVDTNLFFVKRLTDELRRQSFGVVHCAEPAYALTAVEWNMPVAILCATNLPTSDVYAIPRILQSDERTRHISVVAVGDSGQKALLEAFRAGYDDYVERRLGAHEVASHLVAFLLGRQNRFQVSHSEGVAGLCGVIRNLSHLRETGALRVQAAGSDGIIFFKAGELIHGESAGFIGDAAVLNLIENCSDAGAGVYKFVRGCALPCERTVQSAVEELIEQ